MEDLESSIEAVRRFNRVFTRRIGILREGLLHSSYSLAEARILFELAHREDTSASDLARELGLDPGYLSRTLARLEEQGLVARTRSERDGRRFRRGARRREIDAQQSIDGDFCALVFGAALEQQRESRDALHRMPRIAAQSDRAARDDRPFDDRHIDAADGDRRLEAAAFEAIFSRDDIADRTAT